MDGYCEENHLKIAGIYESNVFPKDEVSPFVNHIMEVAKSMCPDIFFLSVNFSKI